MLEAPIPGNEAERIAALRRFRVLDTMPEEAFDDLTRLAAGLFGVPIALVSLVDSDRQWFKSEFGLGARQTPRAVSFCGHAVAANELLYVEDARADERFSDNPLVTDAPNVTFYAGAPIRDSEGFALGTMCVIDSKPRTLTPDQVELLEALSRTASRQLQLRLKVIERDELLNEKKRLAERKDEYVATINHELRTPLTSIRGSLKLLRTVLSATLDNKTQKLLEVAERNSNRLLEMVNGLLDLEKLHSLAETLRAGEVDLGNTLLSAKENAAGFAAEHGITLNVAVEGSVPTVAADEAQMLRVLDNLLSNAIKYSPKGGTVQATVLSGKEGVVVTVADSGPGVPEDFRPTMFEPFTQAAGSGQPASSGLGLSIVQKIVTLHGGTLSYDDAPGGGAAFSFTLPHLARADEGGKSE